MSITGIIAAAIMTVIALAWISYPLMSKQHELGEDARRQRQRDELLTSYERVISTIRDLDEDFRTGKMNEDDYAPEREWWSARGVEILHQMEKVGGLPDAVQPAQHNNGQEFDDAIEDAVSQYIAAMKEQAPTE